MKTLPARGAFIWRAPRRLFFPAHFSFFRLYSRASGITSSRRLEHTCIPNARLNARLLCNGFIPHPRSVRPAWFNRCSRRSAFIATPLMSMRRAVLVNLPPLQFGLKSGLSANSSAHWPGRLLKNMSAHRKRISIVSNAANPIRPPSRFVGAAVPT